MGLLNLRPGERGGYRYRRGDENRLEVADDTHYRREVERAFALQKWLGWNTFSIRGFEHVPETGGAMLVANHGILPPEPLILAREFLRRRGRYLRVVSDRFFWRIPVVRDRLAMMGFLVGTPENAERIIERGDLLLVYPGGAREAVRPSTEAYQLRWEGRVGFVRTALAARVPILPVSVIGADHVYDVWYTEAQERLRNALGLEWIAPMVRGVGIAPRPTHFDISIGAPIRFDNPSRILEDDDLVLRCQREVQVTLEAMLAEGLAGYEPYRGLWPFRAARRGAANGRPRLGPATP